jgi:hypothetical protein
MISADFSLDPYPGLRPFRQEETDIFFGREEHTDQLLERLASHRFLAVTGLSGCGKSSLVRAGLVPALNRGFVAEAGHRWRVAQMRPGRTPFARLAGGLLNPAALASEREGIAGGAEFVEKTLRRGPMGLAEVLRQTPPPAGTNLLLVVDQFEEIFRFRTEDEVHGALTCEQSQQRRQRRIDEAEAFVQLLLASKDQLEFPIFVLLTMRTDYLGHCAVFRGLLEVINESQYIPPPLNRDQLIEAIAAPAQVFNGRVEETLWHRLLNDAGSSQDQLPLLQHALMRMWNLAKQGQGEKSSQHPMVLTVEDYARIGSIRPSTDGANALSRHGREVLDTLNEKQRGIAEMLFRALSGGAADRRDTRRFVSVREVAAIARVTPEEVIEVADVFRAPGCDFITAIAGEDPSGKLQPGTELDISHESLIRHWDAVKGWADREARAGIEYRRLVGEEERYSAGHRAELTALELQNALAWQRDFSPNDVWAQRYGGSYQKVENFLTKSVQAVKRERLKCLFVPLAIIAVLALVGFYLIDQRKQERVWEEEVNVDFSQAPPLGPNQIIWLKKSFDFKNREATASVDPWEVQDNALMMKQNEWCWLNKTIRDDTKVVVDLQFDNKPEGFQICINAKERLQNWSNNINPAGYSCWFGKWDGSMDFIARNDDVCETDFNSLLASSLTGKRSCSLTFMREDDKVSLLVDGKEVHHETYLVPLFGKRVRKSELGEYFEHIGIRTSGTKVKVSKVCAYRKKLAEKASPIVAGDALVEAGVLKDAVDKYKTLAKDYKKVSQSISALALTKGYLLANHLEDADSRNWCYQELKKLEEHSRFYGLPPFQCAQCAKYWEKIEEADTLNLWKNHQYLVALDKLPGVFKADRQTRIVMECLRVPHQALEPKVSEKLLPWIAETFVSTPELAGLNISSFKMTDLGPLAGVHSLQDLDCHGNQLTSLDPLRGMHQLRELDCHQNQLTSLEPLRKIKQLSALYCGENQISTLEPVKAPNLFWLYCNNNQIESLEPLSALPTLDTLYCGQNRIKDLSPLNGKLQALDCSHNQIRSLDPISRLPQLSQLYCRSNQISSLEPLRLAEHLQYLDCGFNAIQTLEPLKHLPLESLMCSGNQITSLEPLRQVKKLSTLDCSLNAIQTLEPLKDLALNNLDCSGNQIVTLEPFVDAKDPPKIFIFDSDALPDAEIERAIAAWSKKGINVDYGRDLLAKRASKGRKSSRLGMNPGIPAAQDTLKVVVKDFSPAQ